MSIDQSLKTGDYTKYTDEELFKAFADTKDINIRNELVKRNLYIAEILSKKYVGKGVDYDDILQVASLGLIYAVDRFDISKGFVFSSFATPTIIGEIKRYFRDKGWQIRVPRRIQELSGKVRKARNKLEQINGKAPKVSDIAAYLECSQEDVLEAMEASGAYLPISLDLELGTDSDSKNSILHELVGDDDKSFDEVEQEDFLKNMMTTLDETEKKILVDRFYESKTQMEIAQDLNVSQMTISRMEKKLLKKLKKEYLKQI